MAFGWGSSKVTLSLQHHKSQVRGLVWARASSCYAFEGPSHVRARLLSAMSSIENPITGNVSNQCLIPGCKRRYCNAFLTAAFAIASFSAAHVAGVSKIGENRADTMDTIGGSQKKREIKAALNEFEFPGLAADTVAIHRF